jgi:Protein of unknown function DUF262
MIRQENIRQATNKKVIDLINGISEGSLITDPEFQRNLVWKNKDKINFIKTVLEGYPFPEIFVADGDIDVETGRRTQKLVDGQQRITTLYQYFTASEQLKLDKELVPYSQLSGEEKRNFLTYDVVVRDLGSISHEQIIEVFKRINATRYPLNEIEKLNAQYQGEFKGFVVELAQDNFFEIYPVFSANDIRRKEDIRFALWVVITVMSAYFDRNKDFEIYLERYNEEFEEKEAIRLNLAKTLDFIARCNFDKSSRSWQKADLFTLIVELYKIISRESYELEAFKVGENLKVFYDLVSNFTNLDKAQIDSVLYKDIEDYFLAALQGSNDRRSRIRRGEIISKTIKGEIDWKSVGLKEVSVA